LKPLEGIAHRALHIRLRDREASGEARLVDRKSEPARLGREERIADRARRLGIAQALARTQRSAIVVEAFRLDDMDRSRRRLRLDCQRNAGGEPAAAAADENGIEFATRGCRLLRKLEPDGALPGNDMGILERRDDDGGALARNTGGDRFARFARA